MNQDEHKRNEQREHVMEFALNEFIQKGLKAVKMNDIAFALSMSKRTLYEMFGDKEGLLIECFKFNQEKGHLEYEKLRKESKNSLETVIKLYRQRMNEMSHVNPAFLSDIQKYDRVMEHLEKMSMEKNEMALRFTEECVENGLFRKDVDYKLLFSSFDVMNKALLSNEIYKQYGLENMVNTINMTFLRGLCTQKGLEIIDSGNYSLQTDEETENTNQPENSDK